MKKSNTALILMLAFTALIQSGCSGGEQNVSVFLNQLQVPVLKYRDNNPVLQLKVVNGDSVAKPVTSIKLNTDGTDNLDDIKAIRLFFMGKDSLWVRYETVPDKAGNILDPLYDEFSPLQFGKDMKPAPSITFKGEQMLPPGDSYFWVMVELSENASLHNKIDAGFNGMIIAGERPAVPDADPPVRQRIGVAVRKHADDNVDTYRVPGLATTRKGTLLAIYDVRHINSHDLQGDIDIGLSRSTDNGNTWEPMRIVLDMGEWGGLPQTYNGVSDACIISDANSDNILVAAFWMHGLHDTKTGSWIEGLTAENDAWKYQQERKYSGPGFDPRQTGQFLVSTSNDDGQTWSEPVNLTRMCKKEEWDLWAVAPGRGITLEDGTLLFPSQGRDEKRRGFSNITYSKDGGITWKTSQPAYYKTNECAVAQLSDGTVMLNMKFGGNSDLRGTRNGRAVATTTDLGETWTEHATSRNTLREPACMGSLHRHVYTEGGITRSILLFSNPDVDHNPRRRTTVKVSFDDGMTWPEDYWLLLDEWYNRGYSCLTSIDEKTIGIIYEGSQADMTFESIPLDELLKR
ncbi:MAG: exo-alpha-sialidase [Bacteroidales bacterium]|jgi:sialidase-1|nr:exo-alpha-sialidase [Bacteroidales bacterium]